MPTRRERLLTVVPTVSMTEVVQAMDLPPSPKQSNIPTLDEIGALARANNAARTRGGRIMFLADMDNARLLWFANSHHGLKGKQFNHYAYQKMQMNKSTANNLVLLGNPEYYDSILAEVETERRLATEAGKPYSYPTWNSFYRKLKPPKVTEPPEDDGEGEAGASAQSTKLLEAAADLALSQQTADDLRVKVDTTTSELEKAIAAKAEAERTRDAALAEAATLRRKLEEANRLNADLMMQVTRGADKIPSTPTPEPEPIPQEALPEPSPPEPEPEPEQHPSGEAKPTKKPVAQNAKRKTTAKK